MVALITRVNRVFRAFLCTVLLCASKADGAAHSWQFYDREGDKDWAIGNYASADKQYSLAVEDATYAHEKPAIIHTLNYKLAQCYRKEGKYKESELLFEDLRSSALKELGPTSLPYAAILNHLAATRASNADYVDAKKLLEESMSICKKRGQDTSPVLNNLAGVYELEKDYAKAESLMQTLIKQSGKQDKTTLCRYESNLGHCYLAARDYKNAEAAYQRGLTLLQEAKSVDLALRARCLVGIAEAQTWQGRSAEALPLFAESAKIFKQSGMIADLSPTLQNYAAALRASNKIDEANKIEQEAQDLDHLPQNDSLSR